MANYSFDDCTAKDVSGNGHDGTINGNPQCVDGTKGKAFSFDGVSSYISVPDKNADFIQENMTISVFVNPSENQLGSSSGLPIILDKSHAFDGSGWVIEKVDTSNENFSFFFAYFNPEIGDFVNSLGESQKIDTTSGKWNHFTIVKQGKVVRNYSNGILVSTNTYTGSAIKTNTNPLMIGAVNAERVRAFFTGSIDDIRIYNRALSETEVKSLYNVGQLSGTVNGVQKYSAVCKNLKTGVSKKIALADGAKEWNCTAAGLKAKKGENVSVTITGVSQ